MAPGDLRRGLFDRLAPIYEMGSASSRVPAMEGIRGVAVTLVFFVHYYQLFGKALPEGHPTREAMRWFGSMGHAGVDLFFLLSGYLIYSVDEDKHDDEGRERPERIKSTDKTSYDLTFTVER